MKKSLAFLLVLVMVFGFAMTAAAAPKPSAKDGNASIIINRLFVSGTGTEERPIYSVEFTVKIKKPALIGEPPFSVYVVVGVIGDYDWGANFGPFTVSTTKPFSQTITAELTDWLNEYSIYFNKGTMVDGTNIIRLDFSTY